MKQNFDPWYLRLPDGRVIKAKSTSSVRHHLEAGTIPVLSMARRHSTEEWISLAWVAEFADLAGDSPAQDNDGAVNRISPNGNGSNPDIHIRSGGVAARLDSLQLQTVGIRGLVDELTAALDSTLCTSKLRLIARACFLAAIAYMAVYLTVPLISTELIWLGKWLGALLAGAVLVRSAAILTRQTHLELSRMESVTVAEAREGIFPLACRVGLGVLLTAGVGLAILAGYQYLLGELSDWTHTLTPRLGESIFTAGCLVGLALAVVIGAAILVSLVLPAILIVQEGNFWDAISEWRLLLRNHRQRVVTYEGLAVVLAALAAVPAALPVVFAFEFGFPMPVNGLTQTAIAALLGLAISPAVAFLAVANLFIYLNLRYEYGPVK